MTMVSPLDESLGTATVMEVDQYSRTVFHNTVDSKVCLRFPSSIVFFFKILSVLLRESPRDINLNHKDFFGSTALHLAVERGDLDSTVLFLTYGANVNEPDGKGQTPLMKVAAVSTFPS